VIKIKLSKFLDEKSMYYDEIDYSTIKKAWNELKAHVSLPYVIHLVGTNGKGSTGRFLAHYLNKSNYQVLHYSSPHILNFNERIWINGCDVSDTELENTHEKLLEILSKELIDKLTYFEYTTLLSFYLSSGFDYLVLEAGLGGEFDATNVVKNDLTLITTIDYDHQSFLGNTIEEIASTKLRSCDTKMIVNKQVHEKVYEIAKEYNFSHVEQFDVSSLDSFPAYLLQNLQLSLSALKYLNIKIDLQKLQDVELFGRCQKLQENITIDVGHNPLAASVIKDVFLKKDKKISLIYNCFSDKDYNKVLEILKPIINEILIIKVEDNRVVDKKNLLEVCSKLNIKVNDFKNISFEKEYLVFGSFSVVEEFLKVYGEK